MRLNIKDIIRATTCSVEQAEAIEDEINCQCRVDWSEASRIEIATAAVEVCHELYPNFVGNMDNLKLTRED